MIFVCLIYVWNFINVFVNSNTYSSIFLFFLFYKYNYEYKYFYLFFFKYKYEYNYKYEYILEIQIRIRVDYTSLIRFKMNNLLRWNKILKLSPPFDYINHRFEGNFVKEEYENE